MSARRGKSLLKRFWSQPRHRLLFWTGLVGLIFGIVGIAKPIDDYLSVARSGIRQHEVSGDIVLVAIDDRSLKELANWPWPRRYHGQLAEQLDRLGARSIFFDIDFSPRTEPAEDAALESSLKRLGDKVTLALRFVIDPITGERVDNFPQERFLKHSRLANINLRFTAQGMVWSVPYALTYRGKDYPSFSASLSGVHGDAGALFPVDFAHDPRSVRVVSAVDVITGRVPADAIKGKDIVIGTTSLQLGDVLVLPGHGRMSGVYIHILGAETLKDGRPIVLGWFVPFLFGLALTAACMFARRLRVAVTIFVAGFSAFLLLPLFLEAYRIRVEIMPALFLLTVAGGSYGWQWYRRSWRERASINPISGLPNLNALREGAIRDDQILIAARVQNYPEVCATLPAKDERSLVEQITSRLSLGASGGTLYQGDEGIFAWVADAQMESHLDEHLDALHSLFRSPVIVCGTRFDLALTFGVDSGSDRSSANRLGGALVAADEAAAESLRWKRYDPSRPEDAVWRLSILSQLDAAIDAGDLWVAYQPMFDVATRSIIGAEALARWTHPEKGAISPIEFIPAAEQNGRIEKLTEFVLEHAIRGAAVLNRRIDFNLAVNLSPKLLGRFPLESTVMDLLNRYGLDPERLTLEVTETAALATGTADLDPLHRLRECGVRISIDDYGTGLSTLEYVRRIPATEIKVDKSFVQSIHNSNSDKLMVNSTIQLAHSLGQKVVAEGVEDLQTLEALAAMGCDIVQGFYLAKPMTYKELTKMLTEGKRSRAA
jgi:diguanylate cyclase